MHPGVGRWASRTAIAAAFAAIAAVLLIAAPRSAGAAAPVIQVNWTDPRELTGVGVFGGGFDRQNGADGAPAYIGTAASVVQFTDRSAATVTVTVLAGGRPRSAPMVLAPGASMRLTLAAGSYTVEGQSAKATKFASTSATLRVLPAGARAPATSSRPPVGSAPVITNQSGIVPVPASGTSDGTRANGRIDAAPQVAAPARVPRDGGSGRGIGLPAAVAALALAGVVASGIRVLLSYPVESSYPVDRQSALSRRVAPARGGGRHRAGGPSAMRAGDGGRIEPG